ncbi:DUF2306 domain-containing protein [Dongia sp.]|uniref:DUF2306 domain-containing protein n=1 Tax=Dongia sp. TaxID=1977262 RepID=UPI003752EF3D
MGQRVSRIGMGAMLLLASGVALYSLRFAAAPFGAWPGIDAAIRGVVEQFPLRALIHMLVAPVALLLGVFQFLPNLRARHPRFHRRSGRVYVAACVIAGTAGLFTAFHASGGPVAGFGFGLLAVLWIAVTLAAWRAAVRRRFALHRLLMRFSYAMTFAAVTLRLQIPIGFALGYESYAAMSPWLAYTSWVPNVIAVAIHAAATQQRRTQIAPA